MDYVPNAATNVIRFVSFGYNLLRGLPEGDFSSGGRDTGIQINHPIFKFSYGEKSEYYEGEVVRVPDQVSFAPYSDCISTTSTSIYSGAASYRDELSVLVEASGELLYCISK